MNLRKRIIGSCMLAALVLGLSAMPAAADEIYRGTFDLPTAAYWGGALLQPGQYTVSVDLNIANPPAFYLRGEGVSRTFFTASATPGPAAHDSRLRLENINGAYFVRELDAGILGKAFVFAAPKGLQNVAGNAGGQPVTVAVSSGAAR